MALIFERCDELRVLTSEIYAFGCHKSSPRRLSPEVGVWGVVVERAGDVKGDEPHRVGGRATLGVLVPAAASRRVRLCVSGDGTSRWHPPRGGTWTGVAG